VVLSFVPLNFLDHARRGTVAPSSYLKPHYDQNWQILSKHYCSLNLSGENEEKQLIAIGSSFTDLYRRQKTWMDLPMASLCTATK
jgi:hypothetical protein